MNTSENVERGLDPAVDRAITDASLWLVWKNGQQWSRTRQEGLDRWLAESELHRFAYRYAMRVQRQRSAAIRQSAKLNVMLKRQIAEPQRRHRHGGWIAAAAMLAAVAVGLLFLQRDSVIATGVGEHRSLVLEDGTQLTLNTQTRIQVDYSTQRRQVRLLQGEVYVQVAQRPEWPFSVTAGDREVMALGTAFVVRHEDRRVAVTLLEGKVAVAAVARSVDEKAASSKPAVLLAPGERLTAVGREGTKIDHPAMEKLMAWREGAVDIDNMSLAQAAAEMNRYSQLQVVVEGPAAELRVGGVFRSTDVRKFARTVARTYGLSLRTESDRWVLSGTPGQGTDREIDGY